MTSPIVRAEQIPALVRDLYELVARLERAVPDRPFTPDGHLVGSIGEALVSYYYGVELCPPSTKECDGYRDGKGVEVKVTQGSSIALAGKPPHLIVLLLHRDGHFDEVFNGPGALVWSLVAGRKVPRNGQHRVSLAALRRLMREQVGEFDRLDPVRPLPDATLRASVRT